MGKVAASGARVRRMRLLGLLAACVVGLGAGPIGRGGGPPGRWSPRRRPRREAAVLRVRRARAEHRRAVRRRGQLPGFRDLLRHGANASGNGLLTQAPPNTGAGWFTLTTGAWPASTARRTTRSTSTASAFGNRTAAFDSPGVLQAETLAQAAERGGKKVAQIEWAGGRSGAIDGPTIDFRTSAPAAAWRRTTSSPTDIAAFTQRFGLQFDHPAGFAGNAAVPAGRADRRDRLDRTCPSPTARRRRCACACSTSGVDKYGLNAYIYDSSNDGRRRYDRVLFSPTKDGDDAVGDLREGEWADVKVTHPGRRRSTARPARFLVKVERLAADLSEVRLFHTSVTRAIATWPNWPGEPRLHRHVRGLRRRALPVLAGRRLRGPRGRHRQRGDLRRAGPLLGEALPPADQVRARHVQAGPGARRLPGDRRVPAPVPRARHAGSCPTATPTRRTTTSQVNGTPDGRVEAARGVHPRGLPGRRRDDAARPGAHEATTT